MNMQIASTDPSRRTLILSNCVAGQTAGEQGPSFSARRRRRTEGTAHEHVAERLRGRTKLAAMEPRRRGPFLSNGAGGQTWATRVEAAVLRGQGTLRLYPEQVEDIASAEDGQRAAKKAGRTVGCAAALNPTVERAYYP